MPKTPEEKAAYIKAWKAANADKVKAYLASAQAKRKANWGDFLDSEKVRYQKRKEIILERQRAYRQKNAESRAETLKRYNEKKPHVAMEAYAARRARKKSAIPHWVDRKEVREIYAECRRITKATGIKHEVDHIIPLAGKNVCGLHVPWNLQIITMSENRRKWCSVGDPQAA